MNTFKRLSPCLQLFLSILGLKALRFKWFTVNIPTYIYLSLNYDVCGTVAWILHDPLIFIRLTNRIFIMYGLFSELRSVRKTFRTYFTTPWFSLLLIYNYHIVSRLYPIGGHYLCIKVATTGYDFLCLSRGKQKVGWFQMNLHEYSK